MAFYINGKGKNPSGEVAYLLKKFILHHTGKWSEIVFLCIGSDRATGIKSRAEPEAHTKTSFKRPCDRN